MKNTAFACVAAIAVSVFASTAGAMNLGSLSRESPVIDVIDLAPVAEPAICRDLTCGARSRKAPDVTPALHVIFTSAGDHIQKTRFQLITAASAG